MKKVLLLLFLCFAGLGMTEAVYVSIFQEEPQYIDLTTAQQDFDFINTLPSETSGFTMFFETFSGVSVSGFDYNNGVYSRHYDDILPSGITTSFPVEFVGIPSPGSLWHYSGSVVFDDGKNNAFPWESDLSRSWRTPSDFVDLGVYGFFLVGGPLSYPNDSFVFSINIYNASQNSSIIEATGMLAVTISSGFIVSDWGSGFVSRDGTTAYYDIPGIKIIDPAFNILITGQVDPDLQVLGTLSIGTTLVSVVGDYDLKNNTTTGFLDVGFDGVDMIIHTQLNDTPYYGKAFTGSVFVSNQGRWGRAATGVVVTIQKPHDLQLIGHGTTPYSYIINGDSISYTIPSLNPGESVMPIEIILSGASAFGYTLTGTVSSSQKEYNTGDNESILNIRLERYETDLSSIFSIDSSTSTIQQSTLTIYNHSSLPGTGIVEFTVSSGVVPIASGLVSLGSNRYRLSEMLGVDSYSNRIYTGLSFDVSTLPTATFWTGNVSLIVTGEYKDSNTFGQDNPFISITPSQLVDVSSYITSQSRFLLPGQEFSFDIVVGNFMQNGTQEATGVSYILELDPMISLTGSYAGWTALGFGRYSYTIGTLGNNDPRFTLSSLSGVLSSQASIGHTYNITGTIYTTSAECVIDFCSSNTSYIPIYTKSLLSDLNIYSTEITIDEGSGFDLNDIVSIENIGSIEATGYIITIQSPNNFISFTGLGISKINNTYTYTGSSSLGIGEYKGIANIKVDKNIPKGTYIINIQTQSFSLEDALSNNSATIKITVTGTTTTIQTQPVELNRSSYGGGGRRYTSQTSPQSVPVAIAPLSLPSLLSKYKDYKGIVFLLRSTEKRLAKAKTKIAKKFILRQTEKVIVKRSGAKSKTALVYKQLLQEWKKIN